MPDYDDWYYLQGDGQFVPRYSPSRAVKGAQPYPWLTYSLSSADSDWTLTSIVSVSDLKEHLRIDAADTSEDSYLTDLLTAALAYCQTLSNHPLVESSLVAHYATFPPSGQPYGLPTGDGQFSGDSRYYPVISYPQTGGTVGTIAFPDLRYTNLPNSGLVWPDSGEWPSDYDFSSPNTIVLTCRLLPDANSESVPQMKAAVKMICGYWYNAREAVVDCKPETLPLHFKALIDNSTYFNLRGI